MRPCATLGADRSTAGRRRHARRRSRRHDHESEPGVVERGIDLDRIDLDVDEPDGDPATVRDGNRAKRELTDERHVDNGHEVVANADADAAHSQWRFTSEPARRVTRRRR
jgi:hypothetical protein